MLVKRKRCFPKCSVPRKVRRVKFFFGAMHRCEAGMYKKPVLLISEKHLHSFKKIQVQPSCTGIHQRVASCSCLSAVKQPCFISVASPQPVFTPHIMITFDENAG